MTQTLIDKIREAESVSRQLDPIHEQKKFLGKASLDHVLSYLSRLTDGQVFNFSEEQAKNLLNYPFPEEGIPMEKVLEIIRSELDEQGLKAASGTHLGYVPGGGVFAAGLGDLIAAICNYYVGVFYVSPGGVRMENMIIRWVAEMIGYDPAICQGNLSSGGSYASLIAMHAAREHLAVRARDVEQQVIYLTQHTHHAITKALKVIGMGEAIYRIVPMDSRYRMDSHALAQLILHDKAHGLRPAILIGSAGTTDVGAIDPLPELANIAQKHDMWFHVDAAYGGFFCMVDEMKAAFTGLEQSDSVVIDPHKSLFMPWGSGMVVVRDGQRLVNTYQSQANYLQDLVEDSREYSPADLSPELTKHFRGLRIWLPLQLCGVESFRAALKEKILLTQYAYERFQSLQGFEIGPFPQLSVIIFRYISCPNPNSFNAELIRRIQADGRIFISSTQLDGIFYLRLTILHFRTHLREVNLFFQILLAETHKLLEELEKNQKI